MPRRPRYGHNRIARPALRSSDQFEQRRLIGDVSLPIAAIMLSCKKSSVVNFAVAEVMKTGFENSFVMEAVRRSSNTRAGQCTQTQHSEKVRVTQKHSEFSIEMCHLDSQLGLRYVAFFSFVPPAATFAFALSNLRCCKLPITKANTATTASLINAITLPQAMNHICMLTAPSGAFGKLNNHSA